MVFYFKRIVLSLLLILTPVLIIDAQGSSGGLPPDSSTGVTTPAEAVPTSRATTSPGANVVVPKPTPTPTPTESAEPISPESSSIPTWEIALGGLAGLLAIYGAYQMNTKSKSEEKDEKSRCADIKQLMNKKLEEVTDLKAQLQDKLKESGREMVREQLSGTPEGATLALIETGEKEYNRLKGLFEECLLEFDAKKKIIVIHGWSGSPEDNWLPWFKSEASKLGHSVIVPKMTDTDSPHIEKWIEELSKAVGTPDHNTYLVGHSIGCQTILRYLEKIDKPIGGAVFVSGWFNLENIESKEEEEIAKPWIETPIDLEKVKKVLPKSTLIISDNDPYGAFEENKKKFTELGSKIVVLHDRGHITDENCPEVIEELDKF